MNYELLHNRLLWKLVRLWIGWAVPVLFSHDGICVSAVTWQAGWELGCQDGWVVPSIWFLQGDQPRLRMGSTRQALRHSHLSTLTTYLVVAQWLKQVTWLSLEWIWMTYRSDSPRTYDWLGASQCQSAVPS